MISKFKSLLLGLPLTGRMVLMASSMLLPMVILLYLLLGAYGKDLDFARLEIKGTDFGLSPVSSMDVIYQAHILGLAGGDLTSLSASVTATNQKTKELSDKFGGDLKFNDADLTSRKRAGMTPASLQEKLTKFASGPTPELYNDINNHAKAILAHVGDMSNLILDSDLDSYYVMDVWLAGVPTLMERMHDLAAANIASAADANAKAQVALNIGIINAVDLPRVTGDVDTAISEDPNFYGPNPGVQKSLRTETEEFQKAVQSFIDASKTLDASNKDQVKAYGNKAKEAFDATQHYWEQISGHLKDLLATRESAIASQRQTALFWSAILLIVCGVAIRFAANAIAKSLDLMSVVLGEQAFSIASETEKIAAGSSELSSSVSQQAAALQETSSTMDEISAMTARSSDGVQASQKEAEDSKRRVEDGRSALQSLVTSVNEMETQQKSIISTLQKFAGDVGQINGMIREIGQKTSQINDIVFQTKLLSFNASVEAARAGEQGKGFSVVAEEVGVLATQSGKAASEINSQLNGAYELVDRVTSDIASAVKSIDQKSAQVLSVGRANADRCNSAFDRITSSSEDVLERLGQVIIAAKEQQTGITQIAQAIGELDQATQKNSNVADVSSTTANELTQRVDQLQTVVVELNGLIRGRGKKLDAA